MEYDQKHIKSFVKTYFKMKGLNPEKLDNNTYIPSFNLTLANEAMLDFFRGEPEPSQQEKSKEIKQVLGFATLDLESMILELENDVEIYF